MQINGGVCVCVLYVSNALKYKNPFQKCLILSDGSAAAIHTRTVRRYFLRMYPYTKYIFLVKAWCSDKLFSTRIISDWNIHPGGRIMVVLACLLPGSLNTNKYSTPAQLEPQKLCLNAPLQFGAPNFLTSS